MTVHDPAAGTVAQADALVGLRRYDEALRLVAPVLTAEPDHLGAGVTAAVCLINLDRSSEARGLLTQLAAAHPEAPDPPRLLSFIAVRTGNREVSLTCANRAVFLAPWSPETHMQLAEALTLRGRHDEAVQSARRALELAPHSAAAHLAVADALVPEEGGRPTSTAFGEAEGHIRRALELAPDNGVAHNALGRIHVARGNLFAAAHALSTAVATDWRVGVAVDNIAVVFARFVWRGHIVLLVLHLLSAAAVGWTSINRGLLGAICGTALLVLCWVWIKFGRVVSQSRMGFLREFARRQPMGAAWGALLHIGAIVMIAMAVSPDQWLAVMSIIVRVCLVAGVVLSWLQVAALSRRQR